MMQAMEKIKLLSQENKTYKNYRSSEPITRLSDNSDNIVFPKKFVNPESIFRYKMHGRQNSMNLPMSADKTGNHEPSNPLFEKR